MSDLVGNPGRWFSHAKAYKILSYDHFTRRDLIRKSGELTNSYI